MHCRKPRLSIAEDSVHVWLARTDSDAEWAYWSTQERLLSPEESARLREFRSEERKREFLCARALLRKTLSLYAECEPEAWEFTYGAHGKPGIASGHSSGLYFSHSHSGGVIALLLSTIQECGIDIEKVSRKVDPLALGREVFSLGEYAGLEELPPLSHKQRFFELWTLKEAYIKARGLGLSMPLDRFSLDLGRGAGEPIRIRFDMEAMDDPTAWQFRLLSPEPGYQAALAVRAPRPFQVILRWNSVLQPL